MARVWTVLVAAAAWAGASFAATPPPSPPTLPLTMVGAQERLAFRLDEAGHPIVLDRRPVEGGPDVALPTDFTKEQIGSMKGVKPITAAPDTVVATLWFDKGVSTLKVENGFDHPIAYVATLTARRGAQTLTRISSTCPVRARSASYETWPDRLDAVAIDSFRALGPSELACNGDSTLSLPPRPPVPPPADINACNVGSPVGGPPPVGVRLEVSSADGAIRSRSASWGVASLAGGPMPTVVLDYPVQGDAAAAAPDHIGVFEAMKMNPRPPSPTAEIVIIANGVERARRPWGLYAQEMAKLDQGGKLPDFFVGLIPISAAGPEGQPDPAIPRLLAEIGSGQVKMLEVDVVGAKGGIMDRHRFALDASPVHDPAILTPLLRQAEAEAAAPGHCARQETASR